MYPDRKFFSFARAVIDVVLIAAAFVFSSAVAWPYKALLETAHGVLILFAVECVWLLSAQATHLYEDYRSRDFMYELVAVLKKCAVAFRWYGPHTFLCEEYRPLKSFRGYLQSILSLSFGDGEVRRKEAP